MSDEREREVARLAGDDPAAAFDLFRMHQRVPQPSKDGKWPSCCDSCRNLVEKVREWFSKWSTYLTDPRYAVVFERPELFEGDVSNGREWGVPALDELRRLSAQSDTMIDVIRHIIGDSKIGGGP